MIPITEERRKFQRILFSKEDKIVASISFSGNKGKSLDANIMNLSEGGMCLIFRKDAAVECNENEILNLTELRGIEPELPIDSLQMKVKWVMDVNFFEHIQIGCEFLNASDTLKEHIRQIEAAETAKIKMT